MLVRRSRTIAGSMLLLPLARLGPGADSCGKPDTGAGAVPGVCGTDRAAAAARRDGPAAAVRGGPRDVLAPGPLDVGRRELGMVSRPVCRAAGAPGGVGTWTLGSAAVGRLRLGGWALAGLTTGDCDAAFPSHVARRACVAPARRLRAGLARRRALPRSSSNRRHSRRPDGGDGARSAASAAQRAGATAAAGRGAGRMAARPLAFSAADNWAWQPGQYVPPPPGADDMGPGPLGAATQRRMDMAGGPLGLSVPLGRELTDQGVSSPYSPVSCRKRGLDAHHETAVVPSDAVHRTAGGLPAEASVGLGRHPLVAVRSEARASDVQRLHGRDGVRGGLRLRRGVLQRASFQRLRPDAVAQPDRLGDLARARATPRSA